MTVPLRINSSVTDGDRDLEAKFEAEAAEQGVGCHPCSILSGLYIGPGVNYL